MTRLYDGWWSNVRRRKMRHMLQAGSSFEEIGQALGCSADQVKFRSANMDQKAGKIMHEDQERDLEQRQRDNRFVVELARAFQRGDHL